MLYKYGPVKNYSCKKLSFYKDHPLSIVLFVLFTCKGCVWSYRVFILSLGWIEHNIQIFVFGCLLLIKEAVWEKRLYFLIWVLHCFIMSRMFYMALSQSFHIFFLLLTKHTFLVPYRPHVVEDDQSENERLDEDDDKEAKRGVGFDCRLQ